jgi:hypothetical protein
MEGDPDGTAFHYRRGRASASRGCGAADFRDASRMVFNDRLSGWRGLP